MVRSHIARVTAVLAVAGLLAGCAWIRQADVSITGGDANRRSINHWVSANGRYVYFSSYVTNLVPETGRDPGIRTPGDLPARQPERANRPAAPQRPAPRFAGRLARPPAALDLRQRVPPGDRLWNRDTGTTTVFALDSDGQPVRGFTTEATISADGRYVAFRSDLGEDLATYVRDLQTGITRLLATDSKTPANEFVDYFGFTEPLSLSRDGSVLSTATCVRSDLPERGGPRCLEWSHSLIELPSRVVSHPLANQAGPFSARISDDGRILVSDDGTSVRAYNRISGAHQVISVRMNGQPGGGFAPSISANGRYVAFASADRELTTEDDSLLSSLEIYVRDRKLGITRFVSTTTELEPLYDSNSEPFISADGRYVVFENSPPAVVSEPPLYERLYTKSVLIPRITDVSPDSVGRAQPVRVTITGSGFTPDADVVIGRRGHALFHAAPEITETTISFDVGTDFGTPLGAYDVSVAIPGTGPGRDAGAATNCAGCFTVTAT